MSHVGVSSFRTMERIFTGIFFTVWFRIQLFLLRLLLLLFHKRLFSFSSASGSDRDEGCESWTDRSHHLKGSSGLRTLRNIFNRPSILGAVRAKKINLCWSEGMKDLKHFERKHWQEKPASLTKTSAVLVSSYFFFALSEPITLPKTLQQSTISTRTKISCASTKIS